MFFDAHCMEPTHTSSRTDAGIPVGGTRRTSPHFSNPHFSANLLARGRVNTRRRAGLTLLEVVIALAIFLFSMAALSHLMSMSGSRALDGYIRSQATLRCQSKLAEVIAGAVPLQSSIWSAFDDDADWSWRLDCEQGAAQGLWNVHVWVQKKRPDGSQLETTISQIVLAPAQRGSTLQDPGTAPATTTPATDSTSGSTSGSTTGSSGTTDNSDE